MHIAHVNRDDDDVFGEQIYLPLPHRPLLHVVVAVAPPVVVELRHEERVVKVRVRDRASTGLRRGAQVRAVPGKGRGLFAAAPIRAGTVLHVGRALAACLAGEAGAQTDGSGASYGAKADAPSAAVCKHRVVQSVLTHGRTEEVLEWLCVPRPPSPSSLLFSLPPILLTSL